MADLTSIVIEPSSAHRYSIIWMHGLGADGHDFEMMVPELTIPAKKSIRFIFPNAPVQPVTINAGMSMRAWYDIIEAGLLRKVDIQGIYRSAAQIADLIDAEVNNGIAPEHIILAGFSQGGVIALHTGLRYPKRLGGVLALSTYLPTIAQLSQEAASENLALPIFMAHGVADPVVPIELAIKVRDSLLDLHYPVQWHQYPMQHSVCIQEVEHISAFISTIFNK